MHRKLPICVFLIFAFVFAFIGCSFQSSGSPSGKDAGEEAADTKEASSGIGNAKAAGKKAEAGGRATVQTCLVPEASGDVTYGDDTVSIDASHTDEGYVMIRYQGGASKVKVQITVPDSTTYTYTLAGSSYETFPLSEGDGSYKVDVLEHVQDDMYALAFSQEMQVELADEFRPFLYPNQYAWFTRDDETVACGIRLSGESADDLDYVERVYLYIIENITYDEELAATVTGGYLPDVDRTLQTKKGICFDYASLMAAMLR